MPNALDAGYDADNDLEKVFADIYDRRMWGHGGSRAFYSGVGSHRKEIVDPYIKAVRGFVSRIDDRLVAIDLGCGDFNVGRNFCDLFADYTACDIVSDLVAQNALYYKSHAVRFRRLDIVADPLPAGDLVFLRQVLQHLSNDNISKVVEKLPSFRFVVLTEHLPLVDGYRPNVDKTSGFDIRPDRGSGVSITDPPFSLKTVSQELLCEAPDNGGVIRTIAYTLR